MLSIRNIFSSFVLAATLWGPSAFALNVGDTAPAIQLSTLATDGTLSDVNLLSRDLGEQRFTMLEFFSITCGPCVRNLPTYNSLGNEIVPTTKTRLVAIDRDVGAVTEFVNVNRAHVQMPVSFDNNRDALRAYGVRATPTLFILDANQQIIYKHVGTLSAADVSEIRSLVQ